MPQALEHLSTAATEEIIAELVREEAAVGKAADEAYRASIKYQLAARRYGVIRDRALWHFGGLPYSIEGIPWPSIDLSEERGHYRFLRMEPGAAAVAALVEAERPLSLDEIVNIINYGPYGNPETVGQSPVSLKRAINAALMRKKGVVKTQDGKYSVPDDDLVFPIVPL